MKWTSWVTFLGLGGIVALVVWSSLGVGGVRCEVCVGFQGREVCRTVDGDDETETRMAAVTNACALVSSGVTDTMACQRAPLRKDDCRAR